MKDLQKETKWHFITSPEQLQWNHLNSFIFITVCKTQLIFLTNACKSSLSLNNKFKLINIFIIQENWLNGKHTDIHFIWKLSQFVMLLCINFLDIDTSWKLIWHTCKTLFSNYESVGELTWGSWVTMWQIVPLVSFLLTATFPA